MLWSCPQPNFPLDDFCHGLQWLCFDSIYVLRVASWVIEYCLVWLGTGLGTTAARGILGSSASTINQSIVWVLCSERGHLLSRSSLTPFSLSLSLFPSLSLWQAARVGDPRLGTCWWCERRQCLAPIRSDWNAPTQWRTPLSTCSYDYMEKNLATDSYSYSYSFIKFVELICMQWVVQHSMKCNCIPCKGEPVGWARL